MWGRQMYAVAKAAKDGALDRILQLAVQTAIHLAKKSVRMCGRQMSADVKAAKDGVLDRLHLVAVRPARRPASKSAQIKAGVERR